MKCPKCGSLNTIEDNAVYASNPPQYKYFCCNCQNVFWTSTHMNKGNVFGQNHFYGLDDGIVSEVPQPENSIEDFGDINWVQKGWQCPICKNVMAPSMIYCLFCSGKKNNISSNASGTTTGSIGEVKINQTVLDTILDTVDIPMPPSNPSNINTTESKTSSKWKDYLNTKEGK